jgi:3-methyladenine DNA glycosylase AlkD
MNIDEIIHLLKEKSNPEYLEGMKRFGIENTRALGIPIPELRKLAKAIKRDHGLALALWKTV